MKIIPIIITVVPTISYLPGFCPNILQNKSKLIMTYEDEMTEVIPGLISPLTDQIKAK